MKGKTMAEATNPEPAKLFIGILYSDGNDLAKMKEQLTKHYGPLDHEAGPFPFDNTAYYREIGESLQKYFLSFEKLIKREDMAAIKNFTNTLEDENLSEGIRRVNIDPGYLTLSNVFLASCKDFYHRVYIGKGIYLENEYRFTGGSYTFWPWTYPDYKQETYLDFFYHVRKLYHRQLKELKQQKSPGITRE